MKKSKPQEVSTQSLLLAAYQLTARELVAALRRAGHDTIRPKHGALFGNIDLGGSRATDIAQRAGVSKAAIGEMIDELETTGYVTRSADPKDRRAKLIVPTARAREVLQLVSNFNAALERRLRKDLGATRYAGLRTALFALAPDTEPQPRR
ncbi:MAG: MarR family transcriptional regulator [Candidatus Baltobacteraceae bacterium]